MIDYNLSSNPKKSKFYNQTLSNVESLFTPYADCEALIGIYSVKFQQNSEDINLLKIIVKVLDNKDCDEDQLFFEVSSLLH